MHSVSFCEGFLCSTVNPVCTPLYTQGKSRLMWTNLRLNDHSHPYTVIIESKSKDFAISKPHLKSVLASIINEHKKEEKKKNQNCLTSHWCNLGISDKQATKVDRQSKDYVFFHCERHKNQERQETCLLKPGNHGPNLLMYLMAASCLYQRSEHYDHLFMCFLITFTYLLFLRTYLFNVASISNILPSSLCCGRKWSHAVFVRKSCFYYRTMEEKRVSLKRYIHSKWKLNKEIPDKMSD